MSFLPDLVSKEKEDNRPSKKIKPAEQSFDPQAAFTTSLKTSSLLGLNLNNSSLKIIEMTLNDNARRQAAEKLKASNFPVHKIVIGTWEKDSIYDNDIVAKCYFAKKKLVWEILENGLKRKIEISWSDVLSIEAEVKENQPGILKIELGQQPGFYQEIDPQPRKHTQWKTTSDFTNGQASLFRRHFIHFPPGEVEKQYERLVQHDTELSQRCRIPFPTLISPYFDTSERAFSYSFNAPERLNSTFAFCNNNQQISQTLAVPPQQFPSHRSANYLSQGVTQGCYPIQGFNQNCVPNSTQFVENSLVSNAYNPMQANALQDTAGFFQDGNFSVPNAYNPMPDDLPRFNAGWIHDVSDQLITKNQDGGFSFLDSVSPATMQEENSRERNANADTDMTDRLAALREISNKLFDESTFGAGLDVFWGSPAIETQWEREDLNGYRPQNADHTNSTAFLYEDQFMDAHWFHQNTPQ